MKLGMKNGEVKLVPYDPEWKEEFLRIRNELQRCTGLQAERIEHIGSTAIPGISAKPVLDLLLGTDDLDAGPELMKGLKHAGFYRLRVQRPNEIVFAKFTSGTFEEKTHFLHLTPYGQELWKNLIFFRDYLNSNEQDRHAYEALKTAYSQREAANIEGYTDHKEAFVKQIYAKRAERL